jgi:hypothetical protein
MRDILQFALEGIDHLEHSNFGKLLEEEISKLRKYFIVKDKDIQDTNISKLIRDQTGINIKMTTEESLNAYVFVPDLNKNNPIIEKWRRYYFDNVDAKDFFADKHIVEGTVSLKDARVSGDFSKIAVSIVIGSEFLRKGSDYTVAEVVAIILHELGHTFVYFEMLARCTRTNYILSEGVKRLMTSNTKEERIILLEKIEDLTKVKIKDKEGLSNKKRSEVIYRSVIVSNIVEESKQDLNLNVYDSRSFEQLADNFSARFGYAVPLATGLAKIYKSSGDIAFLSPMMNLLFNIVKVIGLVCLSVVSPVRGAFTVIVILLQGSPLDVTYDPPKKRILKIKQQINDVLKNPKLSMKQKQVFIEEHGEIEAILDTMYDNIGVYETLWTYIFPWGVRQKSLIEVQEELESMFNNDLFTSAAKLDVLKLEDYKEETDAFKDLDIALEEYTKAAYKMEQFLILEDYVNTANMTNVSLEDYGDLSKLAGVNISQEDIGDILKHGIQFVMKHFVTIVIALITALKVYLIFSDASGSGSGGGSVISTKTLTFQTYFKAPEVDFTTAEQMTNAYKNTIASSIALVRSIDPYGDLDLQKEEITKKILDNISKEEAKIGKEDAGVKMYFKFKKSSIESAISAIFGDIHVKKFGILSKCVYKFDELRLKDNNFISNIDPKNILHTVKACLETLEEMSKNITNVSDTIGRIHHTFKEVKEDNLKDHIHKWNTDLIHIENVFNHDQYNLLPFTAKYFVNTLNGRGAKINSHGLRPDVLREVRVDEDTRSKNFFWDLDYTKEHNENATSSNHTINDLYKDFFYMGGLPNNLKADDPKGNVAKIRSLISKMNLKSVTNIFSANVKELEDITGDCNTLLKDIEKENVVHKATLDDVAIVEVSKDISAIVYKNITVRNLVKERVLLRASGPVGKMVQQSVSMVTIIRSISHVAKFSSELARDVNEFEMVSKANVEALVKYIEKA